MYGGFGKVLRVDLSREKCVIQDIDRRMISLFIGGRGFNSYTLFMELPGDIDPLGRENIICMAPGALTGTGMPPSPAVWRCPPCPPTAAYWEMGVRGPIFPRSSGGRGSTRW
ncbi:MAG: hypothetical protein J7L61_04935 [Thermoplasmata archaeon]|nr:hypothetical protein [Thermoplasmata archaeon]